MFDKLEFWAVILLLFLSRLRPRSSPSTFFSHQLCCSLISLAPPSLARGLRCIFHRDVLTSLTVSCCSTPPPNPNIFPSFLYSNEPACVEVPPCGSMRKSQQSLSGCTCVKRCVVKGLHAVCWTLPAGGSFLVTSSSLSAAQRGTRWRLPNRQSFEDR